MQRLQRPKFLVHAIRKILNEMKTNSPLHRAKAAAKGHLHGNTVSYRRDLSPRLFCTSMHKLVTLHKKKSFLSTQRGLVFFKSRCLIIMCACLYMRRDHLVPTINIYLEQQWQMKSLNWTQLTHRGWIYPKTASSSPISVVEIEGWPSVYAESGIFRKIVHCSWCLRLKFRAH